MTNWSRVAWLNTARFSVYYLTGFLCGLRIDIHLMNILEVYITSQLWNNYIWLYNFMITILSLQNIQLHLHHLHKLNTKDINSPLYWVKCYTFSNRVWVCDVWHSVSHFIDTHFLFINIFFFFSFDNLWRWLITKTHLFKCTENFTTKKWKFSDKKFLYFTYFWSMFLSRNKKNNVYLCKPQFYYIKLGFKEVKIV